MHFSFHTEEWWKQEMRRRERNWVGNKREKEEPDLIKNGSMQRERIRGKRKGPRQRV
jgi:hypothetical protein